MVTAARIFQTKERIRALNASGKPVPPYLKGYLRRLDRDLNKMRSVAVYYREYSSIENLQLLGENYIKQMKRDLTPLTFQTSILCQRIGIAKDGFYSSMREGHKYDANDNQYLDTCLALKKVDSQKVNKMIKFQSLPRQKRQAIREEVLRMYAETDMSYVEIAEVNGVQLRTVEYIIRNFASELPETPVMRKNKKDASAEDYDALRAEITRLKKELRHEKMRAEALDTMIDVAEEMFNIPVRKKAGTKQ